MLGRERGQRALTRQNNARRDSSRDRLDAELLRGQESSFTGSPPPC